MKSLGHSSKAYLPLSLIVTLISVQPAVFAGSALDPYAHIQAPESPKKKMSTSVPAVDNVVTPSTYVTMPMGGDPAALQPKKPGMFGGISGLMSPVAGLTKPFKNAGSAAGSSMSKMSGGIASSAKSSGGLMKKSASMIGNGFKATSSKIADASTSLLPGGKKPAAKKPEIASSTSNSSSLNELYVNKAKSNMDKAKEANKELHTANTKLPGSTKEILAGQAGHPQVAKKRFIPSVSLPFKKKKPHDETSVAEANTGSGFMQGTLDKKSGAHDLRSSKQLATSDSVKEKSETPVVASAPGAQDKGKKKGLLPKMPSMKLKTPQLASIPFMGKKKETTPQKSGFVAASQEKQSAISHQIPISPGAEAKNSVAEKTSGPFDPTDPYPDVKPTAVAQHPGEAPAKKGGLLKIPSVKMPKIGIPGFGAKKTTQPKKEEIL